MTAFEVVIREPRRNWSSLVIELIISLLALFLFAWFVVMLTPLALHIEVTYGQAIALLALARIIFPRGRTPYLPLGEKQKKEK